MGNKKRLLVRITGSFGATSSWHSSTHSSVHSAYTSPWTETTGSTANSAGLDTYSPPSSRPYTSAESSHSPAPTASLVDRILPFALCSSVTLIPGITCFPGAAEIALRLPALGTASGLEFRCLFCSSCTPYIFSEARTWCSLHKQSPSRQGNILSRTKRTFRVACRARGSLLASLCSTRAGLIWT